MLSFVANKHCDVREDAIERIQAVLPDIRIVFFNNKVQKRDMNLRSAYIFK